MDKKTDNFLPTWIIILFVLAFLYLAIYPTYIGLFVGLLISFGFVIYFGVKYNKSKQNKKHPSNTKKKEYNSKIEKPVPNSIQTPEKDSSIPVEISKAIDSLEFHIDFGDSAEIKSRTESDFSMRKIDSRSDQTIKHLSDYIVLDLETTGLNKQFDRIIEIGAIKISGEKIVEEFSTLINPEIHISAGASAVNGIYDADVQGAPKYDEIVDKLKDFLLSGTILGYNISFDLGFIKALFDKFGIAGEIQYFDVLSYARRVVKDLPNYKLNTVSQYLSVPVMPDHRALDDAKATYYVFNSCRKKIEDREKAEAAAKREARERKKQERKLKYQESPLFDVAFVFTGEFKIPRAEIESMAESVGGLVRTKITSKTDYLVVGDISQLPDWAIERKFGKAEELRSAGKKVKNISETEFYEMITNAKLAF